MSGRRERLNVAVQIDPGDSTRAVRLSGPAVAGWSSDATIIWRVPYDADHARLQRELALLARHIKEDRGDALRRYLLGAERYWKTNNAIHVSNRQKLADALQPWRASVYSALLASKLTDQELVELAESAPSIEIKAEREDTLPLALLPVGAVGATRSGGLLGLIEDAVQLPAFLATVKYISWDSDSKHHLDADIARSRNSLLLRSEDTELWGDIEACLARPGGSFLAATAPKLGIADKPSRLASYLVMPEPIEGVNGSATTPSEICVYAHGLPGEAFSNSLRIHFKFSVGRTWYGRPKKSQFDVESHHISQAVKYAEAQQWPGVRPFIVFSVCYSAGDVGDEAASVPIQLVEYGCPVIAPRTRVTEGFAGPFIEALHRLMGLCSTPGRALLAARWRTLKDLESPLGIVYSNFGI